jgi:transcriptional regulator with XRE-family HTH domain
MGVLTAQLRHARRARGLTQQQLGEGLGISALAITNWESGHDTPTLHHFIRCAEALGLTTTVTGAPTELVPVPRHGEPLDRFRIRCLTTALRTAREHADRTQHQLAHAFEVSTWSVHMWETHRRDPRLPHLIAWCHALDCELTLTRHPEPDRDIPLTTTANDTTTDHPTRTATPAPTTAPPSDAPPDNSEKHNPHHADATA